MGSSLITPIVGHQKGNPAEDADSEEEPLTARGSVGRRVIPRKPVDFVGQSLIPEGWRLCDEVVPAGFDVLGGSACVIVPDEHSLDMTSVALAAQEDVANKGTSTVPPINFDRVGLPNSSRVLLALPEWAVDLPRAQWLSLLPQSDDWKMMPQLHRVTALESLELVVFEFAVPPRDARTLAVTLKNAPLNEGEAQRLYHDFLRLLICLPSLRLWGLLRPEIIYLDDQHRLASLLPLGQLLSFEGARAAIRAAPGVAPELVAALALQDKSFGDDRSRALEADAFGVAALVVVALGGEKGNIELSATACDLLERTFQQDRARRLTAGKAMLHPWLAMSEPPELLMSPRVTPCTPRQGSKACRMGALGGRI